MNEVDKLFDGLPDEAPKGESIFDELDGKPAPEQGNNTEARKPEMEDEPRKNRRHRRLEAQLEQEREARIRAESRAQALSESQRFTDGTDSSVDERFLRIYGDTPETRQAWKLQQDILSDYKEQAKYEALQEIEEREETIQSQTREFESYIDEELENIEDEFNIDVTSDAPAARKARREFLEMVQEASPKDENGTITGYADFPAVWEFYQLKKSKEAPRSERQREIASRSMERSSGTQHQEKKITPGFDGWRKDYGI